MLDWVTLRHIEERRATRRTRGTDWAVFAGVVVAGGYLAYQWWVNLAPLGLIAAVVLWIISGAVGGEK